MTAEGNRRRKLTVVLTACILGLSALFLSSGEARNQTADWDLQKREEMVVISRQLGVTCNYCHDVDNLKKSDMPAHKKALEHMRITELLNKDGFRGNPKVDCFLCHRGSAKPDYKEDLKMAR